MLSHFARRTAIVRNPTGFRCMSTYKPDMESIKKLRAASEAPLKDVKNALVATNGDFPAAFEWLRKKGIARASAKAGRTTAQGLIGVHVHGTSGAIVEVNSETDFVAMNEKFQELVSQISLSLAENKTIGAGSLSTEFKDDTFASLVVNGTSVGELVPELVGKVGENVVARRAVKFNVDEGSICSYLHNVTASGLGRAGAIVALQYPMKDVTSNQQQSIELLGKRLAMHIVAAKPAYLSRDVVPTAVVEKERAFLAEQVQNSGKPAHIVEKMTEGRLNKFFGECTLLEQVHFIEEGGPQVGAFVQKSAQSIGVDLKVAAFARFEIGEEQLE